MNERRVQRLAVIAASGLAVVGWFSLDYNPGLAWLGYLGAVLSAPGLMIYFLLKGVLSPEGGHGPDTFIWVVPVINWFVYLELFLRYFRKWLAAKT
jgi:hypothetical protein